MANKQPHLEYYANGVLLPSPTNLSEGRNKIWSDNSGRSVTAKMIGDILAKKKKFSITWECLKHSQLQIIEDNLSTIEHPFINFRIQNSETKEDYCDIMIYDGTLNIDYGSAYFYDGELTYPKVTDELVQQ